MNITKAQAKLALGLLTDTELAAWFQDKPSKQAVGNWPEDGALPPARQWELKARCPELFVAQHKPRKKAA